MAKRLPQIGPRVAPFVKKDLKRLERDLPRNTGVSATQEEIVGATVHAAKADDALAESVTQYKRDVARWRARN